MRIAKKLPKKICLIDRIYLIALFFIALIYFLPLFIPETKIFITPDSNLSDILHFNYPFKFLLSEALKYHTLPVWTDLIGTGFPLIGEAEIGAFSIVNIVVFSIFSTPIAYNVGYVVTFTMFGWGMYLIGKQLKWHSVISFFVALLYMFNGFHIVQIPHYGHLQVLSYMPFIIWVILTMSSTPSSKLWIILPILINQQIMQGHYQYVFITWVLVLLLWMIYLRKTIIQPAIFYKRIILSIGIGLLLSGIQLVPSYEFFRLSERSHIVELYQQAKSGGFSLIHLLQFVYPYVLGDVRKGTFPTATTYHVSFWEIFSYIGILPFFIALFSFTNIKPLSFLRSSWILVGILLLLCIEVQSPLYLLFYFPPLSWFRMHSRFLSVVTFVLLLIVGFTIEQIQKTWKYKGKFVVISLICIISCIDIGIFALNYHPIGSITSITKPKLFPETSQTERITSIGTTGMWFSHMYSHGWSNPNDYLYFLNGGTPNNNILFQQPSLQVYSGFSLQKQSTLFTLSTNIDLDADEKIASLSASTITTLRLHNTPYILTPYILTNNELTQDSLIESVEQTLPSIRRYKLQDVKPQYYFSYHPTVVQTLEQYIELLHDKTILQTYDAFIHKPLVGQEVSDTPRDPKSSIEQLHNSSTKKVFSVSTTHSAFFIASIYLYPGWEAYLDGFKTTIYPANLSGMGIYIPEGSHRLELVFTPYSIYYGSILTGIGCVLYGLVIIFVLKKNHSIFIPCDSISC